MDRVYRQDYELLLVLTGSPDGLYPVGSSYIRSDGRRAATAVDPEHRSRGLGNAIVQATLARYAYQVSEVRPGNVAQRRILENNGFCPVIDPAVVRRLLGSLWGQVVSPPSELDGSYTRFSLAAATVRRYVMYERR
ncbi:hypothetical protein ACFUIT_36430 [Streptomyces sp. NPDC057239]|uniref:hypothetical protein n=1 Tax=Streptomyces sp. NPDC057239 TaxID=3346061 RepID=UPI003641C914